MDSTCEEFVAMLLKGDSHRENVDTPNDKQLIVPKWFDEEKYNRLEINNEPLTRLVPIDEGCFLTSGDPSGYSASITMKEIYTLKLSRGQKFFDRYFFGFTWTFVLGIATVFAIPSMQKILISTRKSGTPRASYQRLWGTFVHIFRWLRQELKPGSSSWESVKIVRKYHHQASKAASLKGIGIVSQRDTSLSIYAFVGASYLKPEQFGLYQCNADDWESYNHFWAVISYMLGLEDRYNWCLRPFEESREICQILKDKYLTLCMESPPEYFEHMVRAAIEGASAFYPAADADTLVFMSKVAFGVPGYLTTESERILLRQRLLQLSKGRVDIGVKSTELLDNTFVESPQREPRLMYASDYDSIDDSPAYKRLPFISKYKMALGNIMMAFYCTNIGRVILNYYLRWQLFIAEYFPYIAIWRFGFKNTFGKDLMEDTTMKPNSEYEKPLPPKPWYKSMTDILYAI